MIFLAKCDRCGAVGVFIVLERIPEGTTGLEEELEHAPLFHARCTVCEEEWVE